MYDKCSQYAPGYLQVLFYCCHGLLVTGVEGVFGDASAELHLCLGPSDDVSSEVAAAGRQAVDVTGRQDVWPHMKVRHLSDKWLSGVKTASKNVLKKGENT